jgi:hypothetical protein
MDLLYYGQANENDIINNLICFEQFNNFYHKKYKPIKEKIALEWRIYQELGDLGYYAMCSVNKETGLDQLWLQWPPVTFADAYLVAHELGHIVRKVENLSVRVIETDEKYSNVAGYINSVLDDRAVDSMLKNEYNFSLVENYIEEMTAAERILDIQKIMPDTIITHIERTLIYADKGKH